MQCRSIRPNSLRFDPWKKQLVVVTTPETSLPDKDVNSVLKEIEEECQKLRQEEMDIAAVSTRASTKAQEKDNEIQDNGFSLDLDESFFQQSKTRNKSLRNKKE